MENKKRTGKVIFSEYKRGGGIIKAISMGRDDILFELKPVKKKNSGKRKQHIKNTAEQLNKQKELGRTQESNKDCEQNLLFEENTIENKIINSIKDNCKNIDKIIETYKLQTHELLKTIVQLELKGVINRRGNSIELNESGKI